MRKPLLALLASTMLALPAFALDTAARSALVVDEATGTILLQKNADEPLPPASMSKLMTLNMVFEAIEAGRLSMDTELPVSQNAAAKGGSKMFTRAGSRIRVEDLIRGVIIQSGNDACIVLAEGLAGSEDAFAAQMTERAQELGMTNSTFGNATGWPDPNQLMSARDLVFLANRLMQEFPDFYPIFAEESFTWEGITQNNRNPLLGIGMGADGLKTGHTEEAGYGVVGSAKQGERRVTLMISGLPSDAARAEEAERLMGWAFREFTTKQLFEAGETIATAEVWMGSSDRVPLVTESPVEPLIQIADQDNLRMTVRYNGPIEAPIEAGQHIANLDIRTGEDTVQTLPLVAGDAVPRGGYVKRLKTASAVLFDKVIGRGDAELASAEAE
ncbi:D-alanyl-D-alanine carboxypeptidase family protein [Paracoccaceae bacterium GXU_MW_L88]